MGSFRPPSLRAIAAFEAAARHQSFTRAAAELNLTTGAVSHAVKALETRLNRTLFDRSGRKVALTPEGQSLVSRIRLSLSLLSDAFEVTPWLGKNSITISTLPSIAEKVLLPSLRSFRAEMPDIDIELHCNSALANFDADVDVAVRFGPGGWNGVQARHLAQETLFPVASPSYRGGELPKSIEDLRSCDLIRHSESTWRLWLEPMGWSVGDFPSSLAIDDSALVIEAAADGLGVALAREQLARSDLRSGRLVRLFEHAVEAEYSYWAVWSGSSPKRQLIERFVDWTEQCFAAAESSS